MTTQAFLQTALPRFDQIEPEKIEPTLRKMLANHKQAIHALLQQSEPPAWENLMQPMDDMGDELSQFWSPISHMHAVLQSEPLRKAYNQALPLLTEFHTELSQNETLFNAIASIAKSNEFANLNPAQRKIIENDLRDFKLAGIHLPADKKSRLTTLHQELSQLETKFAENLLDATNAWTLPLTDKNALDGLPEHALQLAVDNAEQRNLDGYVITLDYPSYSTAMKYLSNRELRQKIYTAFVTRASELGQHDKSLDNTKLMEDILRIRHEIAQLVGFNNYVELSLATKMAKKPDEVLGFLQDLSKRSKAMAEQEYDEVAALAQKIDNLDKLEAWDMAYYSEKLQMAQFDFTQEDFRPYFPIQKVLDGLFALVNKLYGITVREQTDIKTWHKHARLFSLYDENNTLRSGFYIDLYARQNKRDGAWMDDCRARRHLTDNQLQLPVAYLTCNFMPPSENQPALLTHNDVITLFHEFGHCLHHMLTKVDYPAVGGIHGVPWDAVEFPSQFMENYCWEKELLSLISSHYQTGAPLPDELYEKMLAAKHFQTGLQMMRQLEFALFDFRLHLEYDSTKSQQVQAMLNDVRKETAVTPVSDFNRFQHSFSHIFAGGYAAGYYSYKWAEVLSSDAYAKFEEEGLFDNAIGQSFMKNILEVGGVRDPMDSFVAFRGRKPTVDALLRHSGITEHA